MSLDEEYGCMSFVALLVGLGMLACLYFSYNPNPTGPEVAITEEKIETVYKEPAIVKAIEKITHSKSSSQTFYANGKFYHGWGTTYDDSVELKPHVLKIGSPITADEVRTIISDSRTQTIVIQQEGEEDVVTGRLILNQDLQKR